ncbi:MAG TPA: DNA polymerase ligase N-terminal domain-containing protein [Candidatus Babeliales bacterium]|nr:DNA polymerase ligase N-terminal domain-containing protein [Candidatus Babeliales bacterium]
MSKLKEYTKRRNLKKSKEPAAKVGRGGKGHVFVIQKHDASHLHYDFRLEIGGVLVSWAVPKGPSTNPADKRLAVRTDDHPMGYAKFEGIIPEGEYGGGTIMVWDYGTYENIKEKDGKLVPIKQCLKDGQIEVWLEGHKLQGGYALIKTKLGAKGDNWLLIKMRDGKADARRNPVKTQDKSVLTDRTISQIKKASE